MKTDELNSMLASGADAVVPGVPLLRATSAIAAPIIARWLLAAVALLSAAPGERERLLFGATWAAWPFNIAILSAPSSARASCAGKRLAWHP